LKVEETLILWYVFSWCFSNFLDYYYYTSSCSSV